MDGRASERRGKRVPVNFSFNRAHVENRKRCSRIESDACRRRHVSRAPDVIFEAFARLPVKIASSNSSVNVRAAADDLSFLFFFLPFFLFFFLQPASSILLIEFRAGVH